MQKQKNGVRFLVEAAMIAAIYAVLTLAIPVASFGPVQLRVSEAMCILPLFTFSAVPGLTVGCALANLVGFMMGVNPAGVTDTFFGAFATLLAALLTYWIGKKVSSEKIRIGISPLPAVIFNAVIIGFEIAYVFIGNLAPEVLLLNMAEVGAGEILSCYLLGIPLYFLMKRTKLAEKLFVRK